jgi:hypothetical protein
MMTRPYVILQPSLVRDVANFQIGDDVPGLLLLFRQNMLVATQCTPEAH